MFKNVVFRIVAGLVLLAAIAGIAFFAFNAGMARGAALDIQMPANGQPLPSYGYGMPFGHFHPFFGFGCFAPLVGLFLVFLAFGALRRMVWGPRWGWRYMRHSCWDEKGPEGDFVPPMFAEWHKRAHAEAGKSPDEGQK